MAHTLTTEQQDIIDTAISLPPGSLLKIEAVAGSSKTYTSIKLAEALHGSNCLYLAYNKSIAVEAGEQFPKYVQCKTTHSVAYSPVVAHGLDAEGNTGKKRTVSFLNYRDIKENILYENKLLLIAVLEQFFVSKYITIEDFVKHADMDIPSAITTLANKYFTDMINKTMPCTHGFYLKFFHILLADECIHYDKPFNLLILDEAGDINEVTLEIFLLLPADVKVMVGDSLQNIYSFNHTINGFKQLEGVGITKYLTQSFRCSTTIARSIESFVHMHIDDSITFTGTDHADTTIRSSAILSRTNSGLISYMIDLSSATIPFNTVRPAKELFATMLVLINLKPGCKINDPSLRFLIKDLNNYISSTILRAKYKTVLTYINFLHGKDDVNIGTAITTIFKYGAGNIYSAYKFAQQCEAGATVYDLTLSTAHSSKGLTFDQVELANDFKLIDILETTQACRSTSEVEELRLYYVACSRARISLLNATYLY